MEHFRSRGTAGRHPLGPSSQLSAQLGLGPFPLAGNTVRKASTRFLIRDRWCSTALRAPLGECWSRASKNLLVLVDAEQHSLRQLLVVEGDAPGREEHGSRAG